MFKWITIVTTHITTVKLNGIYTVTQSLYMVDDLNCRDVLIHNLQNSKSNGYQESVNVTENSTCIFVGCVENIDNWRDWYIINGNGSNCTNGNAIYYFIKFLLCFYPCTLYFRRIH